MVKSKLGIIKNGPKIVKSSKGEWKSLSLDPSAFSATDLEGIIGVEELTDYSPADIKSSKKLSNMNASDEDNSTEKKKAKDKNAKKKKKLKKKSKVHKNEFCPDPVEDPLPEKNSLDLNDESESDDVISRMAAWNGLGVPIVLLRALADKSFFSPTKIQASTLPAAIFGRRDILGAAETGSGKTLAFGLPILNGIIRELEKSKDEIPEEDTEDVENIGHSLEEGEMPGDETNENIDNDMSDTGSIDEGNVESDSEENISDHFDNFDGTAQCVRVIHNVMCDIPTDGNVKAKSKYTSRPLFALVLTPTRELAVQISQHLKAAAKYTSVSVSVVVGGLSSQKQERLLNRGPEIVVATPGRLWDLIEEGHPHLVKVDTLKYLAIDETDRMLEKGHFEELQKLLCRINENEEDRKKRQNFVFSATLTLTHETPRYVMKKKKKGKKQPAPLSPAQKLASIMKTVGLTNPKVVDITAASGVAEMLTEAQIVCSFDEKDSYLYYFLQRHPGRTLVFCNSIEAVRRLAQLFTLLGCAPWPLHAKMHQKQRLKNLERFCASPNGVLLATDVAARGLDIPNVQHVIHYQIPRTAEGYVHRSGRTARAQQVGLTVLFMEPSEVITFTRLFRTLGRDPSLPIFPVESEWMSIVKQRVALARRLDKVELQARRVNAEHGWLDKAVKEMDLAISDDELPTSYSREGGNKFKKQAAVLRKELTTLLSKPLFPKGFSSKYPTQTGKLVVPLFPGSIPPNKEDYKETAVDALKNSVEEQKAFKRKLNSERSKLSKKNKRLKKQQQEAVETASSKSDGETSEIE